MAENKPLRKDAERLFLGFFEDVCKSVDKCPKVSRRHLHDFCDPLIRQAVDQAQTHYFSVSLAMDILGYQPLNFRICERFVLHSMLLLLL
jgi:hypothetical protein